MLNQLSTTLRRGLTWQQVTAGLPAKLPLLYNKLVSTHLHVSWLAEEPGKVARGSYLPQ